MTSFSNFKANVTNGPVTKHDIFAGVAGLFLGGPVGALLSPVAYRGFQRRLAPWALTGAIAAIPLAGVTGAIMGDTATTTASNRSNVEVVAPRTVSTEFKGIRFDDVRVEVVKSYSRSGMNFVVYGTPTNTRNEEITYTQTIALALGGGAGATFTDDKGRQFDGTVNIPALLPGETGEEVAFLSGSAMAGAKTVSFKSGMFGNYFVLRNLPVTYRLG